MQTAWVSYLNDVIPPDAPEIQIRECKRAFYAGSHGLLTTICGMLDPGQAPTDADLIRMDDLAAELRAFTADVEAGRA